MKKAIVFCCLSSFAFANNDYIPLSEMSQSDKIKNNFVKKESKPQKDEAAYAPVGEINKVQKVEKIPNIKDIPNIEEIEEIQNINVESKNIETNTKTIDKEFVKDFKKDNILQDTKKDSIAFNRSDFSVTPKISYMHVTLSDEKEEIGKTHLILPEIAFRYKNHILKADYMGVDIRYNNFLLGNDLKVDTDWYRIAYLYNYLNANIGIGYNDYRIKGSILGFTSQDSAKFPTLEVHFKNTENQLQVEYGGFYGKNDSDVKNAYEYYLSLGYKVFNNDNLIVNAGYKNRTIESDEGDKYEYKGPILGISSTF